MDEAAENSIMETDSRSPLPPLTWRDGAVPLLALALAWLYWACFGLENMAFPHLGVLALVTAHFAAVFLVLGRRARLNAGSLFCTAAALALGISAALYENPVFLVMNCFVILIVAALATFALAGHLDPGRPAALWDTVRLALTALFGRLGRPFRTLARLRRAHLGWTVLAAAAALAMAGLVIWLLASADAVFGGLFAWLRPTVLPERLTWHVLRTLALALLLASALCYIQEDPSAPAQRKPRPRRAAALLPVTAVLDLIYIIFCLIQFKYLFGGAEDAAMAGGWAEYARSGFFQLVTITFINLGLVLLGADKDRLQSPGGGLLRALLGLLLGLTAVILVSAFWRMRLYIAAFGMSVLRLLTLWAMAVVCFSLLAAAWKLARPAFRFFPAAGCFALALWCCMNLAGPAGMIADYNVDKYLAGELTEIDTGYLLILGSDALPAAARLDGTPPDMAARDPLPWTQWSWSAWQARQSVHPAEAIEFETGEQDGYKTILWQGRTYAPYGTLGAGRRALGAKLGHLRQDEEIMVYAVGAADTSFWLAEYTDEGWMDDPPMVYRSLDAPADASVPDGVDSLGYDIWG